jgi:phosphate:Na+ symporter
MHFVDLITNLERIADHCSNIAVIVIQQASRTRREFDFHSYLKTVHEGKTPEYDSSFKHFHEKYMESLLAHEKAADLMDETAFTPELP